MPASKYRSLSLAAVLLILAAPTATAQPSDGPAARVDTARRTLAGVRAQLASPGIAPAVRAAGRLVGVEVSPAAPRWRGSLRGLPPELAVAVRDLLGAVTWARVGAPAALRAPAIQLEALLREAEVAVTESDLGRNAPAARKAKALAAEVERGVDREAFHRTALTLAEAIDRTLPVLARSPLSGERDAGCDVHEVPGVLCIGGDGANQHEEDYPLLIDLGGDDRYTNTAGGADPLVTGSAVSVVIDVDGDDTYLSSVGPSSRAAQGTGYLGGTGVLVDGAGDDLYRAYVPPGTSPTPQEEIVVAAQGVGGIGVGILADLDGGDVYEVVHETDRDDDPLVQSTAIAGAAGIGIVLDRGTGDDVHVARNAPGTWRDADGRLGIAAPSTRGFGVAVIGAVALFLDEGGADVISAEAVAPAVGADERRPILLPASTVLTEGFGLAALGGAAVLLTGSGPTQWSMRALAEAPHAPSVGISGFAEAVFGGYGGLHDAGGDDVYRVEAVTTAALLTGIEDGCGCTSASAAAESGHASASVMGGGGAGGAGLLLDTGGSDTYDISAASAAHAEVRDLRTEDAQDAPFEGVNASAESGGATVNGQGLGVLGGVGALHDLQTDGANVYRGDASARASADASDFEGLPNVVTTATTGDAFAGTQAVGAGAGYGELRDVGSATTYRATAVAEALTSPEGEAVPGGAVSSAQASVELGGVSNLIDLGRGAQTNTFVTLPADVACQGTRGSAAWVDCGLGAGVGTALVGP